MNLNRFLIILLLLIGFASIQAQEVKAAPKLPSPEKVQVIKELLATTGSINIANQVMANLMNSLKPAFPGMPEATWDRLLKKMKAEELIDSLIAIYDRHFSTEDLQSALAFYRTAVGQRFIKELPTVMSESMAVGQEWGQKKAAELVRELKAEQEAAGPSPK